MPLSQLILEPAPHSLLPWPDLQGELGSWDQVLATKTEKQRKMGGVRFPGIELGACNMATMAQGEYALPGWTTKTLGRGLTS